jgi:hypothetical protein
MKSEPVITAISASFLLSFTLGFFGPATLYYTNFFEYYFTFSDICIYLIFLTLFFGILLTFISIFYKGKIHQKIVCLIFAFGLLSYIQGNILVWNYGLLNGQEILWNNYFVIGIAESLIWIAVITLSLLYSDKIYKFIPVVCIFLLVIQTGGFLALIHFSPDEPQWKSYSFNDDESKFDFSESSNVVIIVLDTFQSDVFQELINEDTQYQEMFKGFTYYRNTIGGYPTTMASIPLIMTGKYYNNSVPFDTFIQTSYESSSLPKTLKENGFRVDIYESPRLVYPNGDLESNIIMNSFNYKNLLPRLTSLAQISLFRHLPQPLKEAIYPLLIEKEINSEGNSDRYFNDQLIEPIRLSNTPSFKFYHLTGPHPPFRLNKNLEYEELPNNRSGYKEQSKASLLIVGNLLKKLKENGIYDKSFIIIVGDHGMQNGWYGMNNSLMDSQDQLSYVPQSIVTGGIPLMLVKPYNSTHLLAISDVPVSLSDIPKTVATELNVSNVFIGESVFKIQNSDKRNFSFYQYTWEQESWNMEYLPPMFEYTITNFSWYASSWKPTYREYTSKGIKINPPKKYNLGTTIKFGKDLKSQDLSLSGWSPEEEFVWSDGKSATIAFSMDRPNTTFMNLQITAFPFIIENKHEIQRLTVYFNQHQFGNYSFIQPQWENLEFIIPTEYLNEQEQYITFYFPDAISPAELGTSSDVRNLAISLSSFNLSEENSDQILYGNGWYPLEYWSGIPTRWMDSNASLIFYSIQNRTTTINMQFSSFYRQRTLNVSSEGQQDLQVTIPSGFETVFVNITLPVYLHKGENTIKFYVPEGCQKPCDIQELNYSDSRCLSLSMQNLTLS